MAPNLSGNHDQDHIRSIHLVRSAYEFAKNELVIGGKFVAKVFQGRYLKGIPVFKRNFTLCSFGKSNGDIIWPSMPFQALRLPKRISRTLHYRYWEKRYKDNMRENKRKVAKIYFRY